MPHHLKKLTPNLIVTDVSRSIAFYRDALGFTLEQTVPDAEPLRLRDREVRRVQIFSTRPVRRSRNTRRSRAARSAARSPSSSTWATFAESYAQLKDRVQVVMPLEKKWYGVTEFAFLDPDGYIITFAQPDA